MTVSDHRDLVAALLGVPGVAAAAVEPHGGGPGTLRLQLAAGANEVDVAGAVNRLLRSQFGLAVDADRVRVLEGSRPAAGAASAEVPEPEVAAGAADAAGWPAVGAPQRARAVSGTAVAERGAPEPDVAEPNVSAPTVAETAAPVTAAAEPTAGPTAGPTAPVTAAAEPSPTAAAASAQAGRLVIERVQLVSARLGITVSVTLRAGERSVVGEVEGPATSSALHRSVAAATLRAVESVVDDDVRFDVEHVEIASTGTERTALVVVSMVTERGAQRLSGASVVRDDARQAVIRAVLAAVNRRVATMLPGAGG